MVEIATIPELRRRVRQRIELQVGPDGPTASEVFAAVPGVVSCTVDGDVIQLVVEGSADAVVKAASTLTVHRIATPDTDLDDVFRSYYEEER